MQRERPIYFLGEEEAKDKQKQYKLEKAKLAFDQKLERFKRAQKEERERHRSELEKFERQIQAREKGYLFSPSQVQFGVSHREAGDEAADFLQMQEEATQIANMIEVSAEYMIHSH